MKYQSTILKLSLIIYLIMLLYITLFAWNYGSSFGPTGPGGRNYNAIPFRSIYRIAIFSPTLVDPIRILVGNILLFLPFGLLISAIKKMKVMKIVAMGFFLSCFVELSQFLFTYRVANVDDVILNTLGTLIGASIFYVCFLLKKRIIYYEI